MTTTRNDPPPRQGVGNLRGPHQLLVASLVVFGSTSSPSLACHHQSSPQQGLPSLCLSRSPNLRTSRVANEKLKGSEKARSQETDASCSRSSPISAEEASSPEEAWRRRRTCPPHHVRCLHVGQGQVSQTYRVASCCHRSGGERTILNIAGSGTVLHRFCTHTSIRAPLFFGRCRHTCKSQACSRLLQEGEGCWCTRRTRVTSFSQSASPCLSLPQQRLPTAAAASTCLGLVATHVRPKKGLFPGHGYKSAEAHLRNWRPPRHLFSLNLS